MPLERVVAMAGIPAYTTISLLFLKLTARVPGISSPATESERSEVKRWLSTFFNTPAAGL